MNMNIKEQILSRFENTDSGGAGGGRNGMSHREKILLNIALDVFSENMNTNIVSNSMSSNFEFNMHQHWNDEPKSEDDGHGSTIKHFQD